MRLVSLNKIDSRKIKEEKWKMKNEKEMLNWITERAENKKRIINFKNKLPNIHIERAHLMMDLKPTPLRRRLIVYEVRNINLKSNTNSQAAKIIGQRVIIMSCARLSTFICRLSYGNREISGWFFFNSHIFHSSSFLCLTYTTESFIFCVTSRSFYLDVYEFLSFKPCWCVYVRWCTHTYNEWNY